MFLDFILLTNIYAIFLQFVIMILKKVPSIHFFFFTNFYM